MILHQLQEAHFLLPPPNLLMSALEGVLRILYSGSAVNKIIFPSPRSEEEERRSVVDIVVGVVTVVLDTKLLEGADVVFISESKSCIVTAIYASLSSLTQHLDISSLPHL